MTKQIDWVIPVTVDLTAVLASVWLLPKLIEAFSTPSGLNALWLTGAAIWFFLSTLVVRKQETAVARITISQKGRLALAVLFAVGLALAISHQLGYLGTMLAVDPRELGSGESAAFFVFAPGAWLGFSLLYLIFLGFNVKENAQPRPWQLALALLGINAMALLTAVELHVIFDGWQLGGMSKFLLGTGLLLTLVGPPRFIYQFKQSTLRPFLMFALLIITLAL